MTFLDTRDKKVINISVGDSVSVMNTTDENILLNNEFNFGEKPE